MTRTLMGAHFLSFWDSGLWGNLKGLDGYVYDVFEEILMQDEMDINCLS